jgi:hypothetical protein
MGFTMKKVKILKDCAWSFRPSEKIVTFKINEIVDFTDDRADMLINSANAVLIDNLEKKEPHKNVEIESKNNLIEDDKYRIKKTRRKRRYNKRLETESTPI